MNKMKEKEDKSTNLIDKVIKESVGSSRSKINLNLLDEDKFETAAYQKMEKECEQLRSKLLKEYKDIFKEVLDKEDVMNISDIKIDVERNPNIKPSNARTPADVLLHL